MSRRNWVFTLNDIRRYVVIGEDEALDADAVHTLIRGHLENAPYVKACVWQYEIGASLNHHIQGYIEYTRTCRMTKVKETLDCTWLHVEPRMGSRSQAINYCSKDDTRAPDEEPHYYPSKLLVEQSTQGKRNDLIDLQFDIGSGMSIMEISENHFGSYLRYNKGIEKYIGMRAKPRTVKTHVSLFIGPPGCGKTTRVRKIVEEGNDTVYWKAPNNKWWDYYSGEKIVVFDDFSGGWFDRSTLLQVLDAVPLRIECKGGTAQLQATQAYITCNYGPGCWYNEKYGPAEAIFRRVDCLYLWDEVIEDFLVFDSDTEKRWPSSHEHFPTMWAHKKFT